MQDREGICFMFINLISYFASLSILEFWQVTLPRNTYPSYKNALWYFILFYSIRVHFILFHFIVFFFKVYKWSLTDECINEMGYYIYIYVHKNGILFHLWQDGNPVTCYHMDSMLSKIASHQKQILYDSTYYMRDLRVVRFIKKESRMVVARGWGWRKLESIVQRVQSSSSARWKNSEDGWWLWSHKNVSIPNTTELYT